MSKLPMEPDHEDESNVRPRLRSISLEDSPLGSAAVTPKASVDDMIAKNDYPTHHHGYLSAPQHGPLRPVSPSTQSLLSTDEHEELWNGRRASYNAISRTNSLLPSPRGIRGKLQQFWVQNKGLALMLAAQVFGTLMNISTRLLEIEGNKGQGMHPFQILFARMGITLVLASAYMYFAKTPHFPLGMKEVRWLLVARGFGGFFGVFGMYYSLLYLPLADATVITFLAPSLACWACSILINEPFTRVEKFAGFASLVGVILIARPASLFAAFAGHDQDVPASGDGDFVPGNGTEPVDAADAGSYQDVTSVERGMAVGLALIGVLGSACAFTTIRWIGKRAHPLISVNYFAAWCFFVSIIMQSVLPGVGFVLPADLKEWGYLVFLGFCGFVMQFLMAAGLSYEKSSRATNMTYTQMLFALAGDKIIFGHTPGVMSILGSSLILGGAIVVAVHSDPSRKQPKAETEGALDDESRAGLIADSRDVETGEDHDRIRT